MEKSEREWDASEVVKHRGGTSEALGRWYEFYRRIVVVRSASGGEPVDFGEILSEVYEWWMAIHRRNRLHRRAFITEVERLCDAYISAKTFLENDCPAPKGASQKLDCGPPGGEGASDHYT